MPRLSAGLTVALASLAVAQPADAGRKIDEIRVRGFITCGVNVDLPGFSTRDSSGAWSGIDVDLCRGLAAALLGDASKVSYIPLDPPERFPSLQSGKIDVLAHTTTWTLSRDVSLGVVFPGVNYYDGQGFMVRADSKAKTVNDLKGFSICVGYGSTTEENMADHFRTHALSYTPVTFGPREEVMKGYTDGKCQAVTTDMSALAVIRTTFAKPDDHRILPDVISKEPLGPAIIRGDDDWFTLVRWTMFAMLEAEELGITRANVDALASSSKLPAVQRLLGTSGDLGKQLGLDNAWAHRIIKAVGNYGESFERGVGAGTPIRLARGLNNLWNKGGLMYAPPFR